MKKQITEYVITFKDINKEDFVSQNKKTSDNFLKNCDKAEVNQYFSKDWNYVDGDYQEGYVEVFFDNNK